MQRWDWNARDALLLAFAELGAYGIATIAGAEGPADRVRRETVHALRARASHGLGSYVFWLRSDEHRVAGGDLPPLYTSGPEADRALTMALAHQGLGVAVRAGRIRVSVHSTEGP